VRGDCRFLLAVFPQLTRALPPPAEFLYSVRGFFFSGLPGKEVRYESRVPHSLFTTKRREAERIIMCISEERRRRIENANVSEAAKEFYRKHSFGIWVLGTSPK
jgi:hypothetical protein